MTETAAPGRFAVRIINAGTSLNGNVYPDAMLRAAVPLFEGVRVFVKSDADHTAGKGKDIRNLIGRIVEVRYVPPSTGKPGGLEGVLEPLDAADPLIRRLSEAARRKMTGLFGLSIDARAEMRSEGGKRVIARFQKVNSVDLIVDPGAGGGVIGITEAVGATLVTTLSPVEIGRRVERVPGLAPVMKDRLISELEEAEVVTEDRVTEAINLAIKEQSEIAKHMNALDNGHVRGLGAASRIIEAEEDKKGKMLDAFFDPKDTSVRSIRECYVDITGDKDVTGRLPRSMRLSEALTSTTFSDVLGNAMHRRLLADYRVTGIYDVWRDLVTIVQVNDFREQHSVRYGGYGDLPIVNEAAPYAAVTSPTDEEALYSVQKRGGTETITLEMIKNDDVSAVQKVPGRMARAAKRTLGKFVLDFLRTNPTIYDTKALFHADHGNLGTAALSATSVAAGRLAMKAQTEKDSGAVIGIPPRFLWVPDALEQTAFDLFRLGTNNESNFVQSLQWQIRPVWYWTDNNDWCLSADAADIPSIELGFLDGREEPELFVMDSPTSGSFFTNDVITYKIRHIYGGAVTDFRGLYKSVVA